jgi:hypothetical protein
METQPNKRHGSGVKHGSPPGPSGVSQSGGHPTGASSNRSKTCPLASTRHSPRVVIHVLEHGADVSVTQEILGHARLAITQLYIPRPTHAAGSRRQRHRAARGISRFSFSR